MRGASRLQRAGGGAQVARRPAGGHERACRRATGPHARRSASAACGAPGSCWAPPPRDTPRRSAGRVGARRGGVSREACARACLAVPEELACETTACATRGRARCARVARTDTVVMLPPTRSRDSVRSTRRAAPACFVTRAWAVQRPLMPPPTTTTSSTPSVEPAAASDAGRSACTARTTATRPRRCETAGARPTSAATRRGSRTAPAWRTATHGVARIDVCIGRSAGKRLRAA